MRGTAIAISDEARGTRGHVGVLAGGERLHFTQSAAASKLRKTGRTPIYTFSENVGQTTGSSPIALAQTVIARPTRSVVSAGWVAGWRRGRRWGRQRWAARTSLATARTGK